MSVTSRLEFCFFSNVIQRFFFLLQTRSFLSKWLNLQKTKFGKFYFTYRKKKFKNNNYDETLTNRSFLDIRFKFYPLSDVISIYLLCSLSVQTGFIDHSMETKFSSGHSLCHPFEGTCISSRNLLRN